MDKPIYKVKGVPLAITTGAGTEVTPYQPNKSDGKIIGVSISEAYDRPTLAQLFITLEQADYKPLDGIAATTLIMEGGKTMHEFDRPLDAGEISITVESASADTLEGQQPRIMFFFAK